MLKGLPYKAKFARRQIILDHVRGNKLVIGISKVFIVLVDKAFNDIDAGVAGAVPIDAAGNPIVAGVFAGSLATACLKILHPGAEVGVEGPTAAVLCV